MKDSNKRVLDVYIAKLPSGDISAPLIPEEREREVRSVRADTVRREKYFVWRLLEHAILNSFEMDISSARLTRSNGGKWISPYFYLSLSHSKDALAVAVSTHPVGVDVEGLIEPRAQTFAVRVLNSAEYEQYTQLDEESKTMFLTRCWTLKESDFKRSNDTAFIPAAHTTVSADGFTDFIKINDRRYCISVSSELSDEISSLKWVTL